MVLLFGAEIREMLIFGQSLLAGGLPATILKIRTALHFDPKLLTELWKMKKKTTEKYVPVNVSLVVIHFL